MSVFAHDCNRWYVLFHLWDIIFFPRSTIYLFGIRVRCVMLIIFQWFHYAYSNLCFHNLRFLYCRNSLLWENISCFICIKNIAHLHVFVKSKVEKKYREQMFPKQILIVAFQHWLKQSNTALFREAKISFPISLKMNLCQQVTLHFSDT